MRSLERTPGGVRVEAEGCETETFDEVVVAAHADQALAMLARPTEAERDVLGAVAYQPNQAVLHTDTSVMPRRRSAWASWNAHLVPGARDARLTYWMNLLQSLDAEADYLVSLEHEPTGSTPPR